jgi:hypothetical protein
MSDVNASFDNITLNNIEGYKISACLQAGFGFNGAFFVYIEELISANAPKGLAAVDMSTPDPAAGPKTVNLRITDTANYRDYTFNNIDLIDIQTYITQHSKTRLFTFKFDAAITNGPDSYCTINNNEPSKDPVDAKNRTAQAYLYSLDGFNEPLLSFSGRFSRDTVEVFRYGSRRSKDNSFTKLAIKMDEERKDGGILTHDIKYKGLTTTVSGKNLQALLVDESYGSLLHHPLPSLSHMARATNLASLVELNFDPHSPFEYLQHAEIPPAQLTKKVFGSSVETATYIINRGGDLDKSKSII